MEAKQLWQKNGFTIRLAKASDAADYYFQNYCPLDKNVARLTGRAEKAYLRAGFKREGVRRDAVMAGSKYADDILMAILEDDWREPVEN